MVAAFELCFKYQKEFFKKKVCGEIAFDFICVRYKYKSLQEGQLSQERLSFLQNLLNFVIKKYLKQEVDDNLSFAWMNIDPVAYNWRYKDLSTSRGQKVMTLLPPMKKYPINFYHRVAPL